jgi:hypothetical protein
LIADDPIHEQPICSKPPVRAAGTPAVTYRTRKFLAPVTLLFGGPQRFVSIQAGSVGCCQHGARAQWAPTPQQALNLPIAASIELTF